jgi:hypothetical protein
MVLRTGNQISNMNSFVQERVTGMKILQLFNRRKLNPKIQGNQRYKKSMDQNNLLLPFSSHCRYYLLADPGFIIFTVESRF